jgi:hypothetical protein
LTRVEVFCAAALSGEASMSAVMYAGSSRSLLTTAPASEHDLTFERVDFDRVRGLIYELSLIHI